MPTVNTSPSRIGQTNLSGDVDSLFLKVFSGEVITTFEENNVMMPLHRVRTITSGKSAQFPVSGVASAGYHTAGESILGAPLTSTLNQGYIAGTSGGSPTVSFPYDTSSTTGKYLSRFKHNEKTIFIDDVLVSSVFVADIDEMKNHYDVRSIYSTEIGRALAYTADKNLIRAVIGGARATADRFGGTANQYMGTQITVASTQGAAEYITALYTAAQKMDEKNVPSADRFAILPPAAYYALASGSSTAINRDYNDGLSNGSVAKGEVVSVAGIRIFKSNHCPSANESGGSVDALHGAAGVKNTIGGSGAQGYSKLDFSKSKGVVFQREALATVKLLDLSLETDYITERMGTLMLAKYAMGHNVLREEACMELIIA
jgi:hypothetical protein